MSIKNFKVSFIIDGNVEDEIRFFTTNPIQSTDKRISDAKFEIKRQKGIEANRLSNLVLVQID